MATYFVKSSGGTGAGTSDATAWSYSKYNSMAATLASGDIIKFLQGDSFYGSPNLKSGSSGNPITYTSYNNGVAGANPIINGLTTISSWTSTGTANVYSTTAVNFSGLQGVYVDGQLRGMGRYPNTGYLTYTSHTAQSSGLQSISGSSVATLPVNFSGGEVVIKKWRYIIDRHTISSQTSSTITYSLGNTATGINNSYDPTDGNGYFIQNHLSCLDTDGDWYYNNSTHTLYVYFSGSPSGRVVKVNSIDKLASMNSMQNIVFAGLDFVGGNMGLYCNAVTNITVTNCNFKFQSGRCSIYADGASNFNMTGGSIADNNNTGFLIEQNAANCTVDGVSVTNIGLIPGAGWSGDHAGSGVWMNGDGNTVRNCTITNIGYIGIGSYGSNNWLVEKNIVDNFCLTKDDGGGIYCYNTNGVDTVNRVIQYNTVLNAVGNSQGGLFDGNPNGEAAAIYLDGYSNHTTVSNNVCKTGNWCGMLINGNSFNTVSSNIFYDFLYCIAISQVATSGPGSVRSLNISNNKFIARFSSQLPMQISILNQSDTPSNFGTFSSNYYARPIAEGSTIQLIRQYPGTNTSINYTVSNWKSTFSIDTGSSASLVTTDSDSKLRFEYNYSPSSSSVSLGAIYKNIANTTFNGTIVIPAWGGELLIYQSALSSPANKIAVTPSGKILITSSNKILIL